ncbi:MAG: hypothetical protein ABSD27_14950 [Bryobacteraceae bacterium]|jgi:hypothetical protein
MRIGIEAACWHDRRGHGRHARALLRTLVRLDGEKLTTALAVSWSCGEPTGYWTGRANAAGAQMAEAVARGLRAAP